MLDIQITTLMFNIKRYIPLALLFAGIILAEIIYLTVFKTSKDNLDTFIRSKNNTEQIGDVLYTDILLISVKRYRFVTCYDWCNCFNTCV